MVNTVLTKPKSLILLFIEVLPDLGVGVTLFLTSKI